MLALAVGACGDDDDTIDLDSGHDLDSGTGGPDAGPDEDAGPEDAGPPDTGPEDAGPPPSAYVRVAALSPDASPFQVCVDLTAGGVSVGSMGPLPEDSDTDGPGFVPFRGVSGYLPFPLEAGVTYAVKFFARDPEGDPVDCTADDPLVETSIDASELVDGAYYTAAMLGNMNEPMNCGAGMSEACDRPLTLVLYPDDSTVDAAATKLRVVHASPNFTTIDVCWAPDTDTAPTPIATAISYGQASNFDPAAEPPAAPTAYFSHDAITGGLLSVHISLNPATPCLDTTVPGTELGTVLAELPIPDAFALIQSGFPESLRASVSTTFELGHVTTIFVEGWAHESVGCESSSACAEVPDQPTCSGATLTCSGPHDLLFVPWQDQPGLGG